jgi:NAD-dependent DNA ligase
MENLKSLLPILIFGIIVFIVYQYRRTKKFIANSKSKETEEKIQPHYEIIKNSPLSYEINISGLKNLKQAKKDELNNDLAQELRETGFMNIQGLDVHFWQNNNFDAAEVYAKWNKIESYRELNSLTEGENGKVVITGVFQVPRREVADYAIKLGFKVHNNVSRNTDYILIGSEKVSPTKIAKMLELNKQGNNINLIDENSFLEIVSENLNI